MDEYGADALLKEIPLDECWFPYAGVDDWGYVEHLLRSQEGALGPLSLRWLTGRRVEWGNARERQPLPAVQPPRTRMRQRAPRTPFISRESAYHPSRSLTSILTFV